VSHRCAARSADRAADLNASAPIAVYDYDSHRRQLRQRGITPEIARRNTGHGSGLGRHRWVVEHTFAWPHQFKRLLVRYHRHHQIHEAFLAIGCCLVCFRRLQNSF
jgi:transposase